MKRLILLKSTIQHQIKVFVADIVSTRLFSKSATTILFLKEIIIFFPIVIIKQDRISNQICLIITYKFISITNKQTKSRL